ncbi:uncharacterized protein LOC117093272 isoform X4 [Trachypithecus francoisi]|uniref:uncharacterized protein LOC117093272 isoform X4 n=1 Tax=Trachypithecus francoisi TaxID=54180 RepID=UPI00141BED84|nr:uncharacterized protein LOC117093272 isoform X4 [Trachypithecus francoisi]
MQSDLDKADLSARVTELGLAVERLQKQNLEKDQVNKDITEKLEALPSSIILMTQMGKLRPKRGNACPVSEPESMGATGAGGPGDRGRRGATADPKGPGTAVSPERQEDRALPGSPGLPHHAFR